MKYFKANFMEMCHRKNFYQINLLNGMPPARGAASGREASCRGAASGREGAFCGIGEMRR